MGRAWGPRSSVPDAGVLLVPRAHWQVVERHQRRNVAGAGGFGQSQSRRRTRRPPSSRAHGHAQRRIQPPEAGSQLKALGPVSEVSLKTPYQHFVVAGASAWVQLTKAQSSWACPCWTEASLRRGGATRLSRSEACRRACCGGGTHVSPCPHRTRRGRPESLGPPKTGLRPLACMITS